MRSQRTEFVDLQMPSPFALPLMVERFREKLTTEKLKDRLDRLLKDMEHAADLDADLDEQQAAPPPAPRARKQAAR